MQNQLVIVTGSAGFIGYHVAHRPWPSCLRVLPNEIKKQVVDHYEQEKIKFKKYDDHIVKEADKILTHPNPTNTKNKIMVRKSYLKGLLLYFIY